MRRDNKSAVNIRAALIKYALEIPASAISNPPVACPVMDDIKYVDELIEIAFCNTLRGTIAAIMLLPAGAAKERIMPVRKTVKSITETFTDAEKLKFEKLTNASIHAHNK